jgi:hypothetical protein
MNAGRPFLGALLTLLPSASGRSALIIYGVFIWQPHFALIPSPFNECSKTKQPVLPLKFTRILKEK